ncbi:HAMP domain-containing protein [Paenibacillus sp. LMG 31457]|uniref:histidine kinase n=2 Tax=Paenibacillus planticolens TaxID=2654976 RepID=A0ABX1ZSR9_9BACL|nr:HAMP domain-containing protein [Paenibacillus planticolens]
MKLQTKLVGAYIFIILVPIIVFSIYLFNDFYKNTVKEMMRSNQYITEMEYNNIMNNINLMERAAQLMLSDGQVKDYMTLSQELDTLSLLEFSNNVVPNLQRIQFNNPNIAHIRMYANNPNIKEMWPIFLNESRVTDEPWYNKVIQNQGLELWQFESDDKDVLRRATVVQEKKAKVSLLREINYDYVGNVGIVQIDMYLDDFLPKVFSSVQDEQSQMLMMDSDSRVYYNSAFPLLAKVSITELKQQLEQTIRNNPDASHFEIAFNDEPYICIFKKLDSLDAYLINVVSLQDSLHKISISRNMIIVVSTMLILILSVITYLTSRILFKRLRKLQNSMKSVRGGNFQVNIDVHGGGEVGEIAAHFKMLMKKINGLIADAVNKQAAAKEAELNALKNQIDSHFLYNTLENLKMLAEVEGQYVISDSLTSLGGMMRYNLQWTSNYVRLKDEIKHIRNYIAIMNIRYDDRISLQFDVPPTHMEQEILKMSLQPIVENAVKHGMQTTADGEELPLVLSIKVDDLQDATVIEIIDNGRGISAERQQRINQMIRMNDLDFRQMYRDSGEETFKGSGIGLRNVNQRVEMNYGNGYGIYVQSVEGKYTSVSIKLPKLILAGGVKGHA